MKVILIVILSFLFYCSFTIAQNYSFVKYSNNEGLPQSQVTAIHQDEKGYLWLGTLGGLSKFNGANFTNFTTENGLYNNRVSSINQIQKKMFIGHEGGISILMKDTILHFALPDETKIVQVKKIIEYNDKILIATNGLGLFEFENNRLKKASFTKNNAYNSTEILKIRDAEVFNNTLYLATQRGIFAINNKYEINTTFETNKESFSGIIAHKQKLYACSYNGNVTELIPSENDFKTLYTSTDFRYRKIHIFQNNIWLNAKNGIQKLNLDGSLETIFTDENGLQTQDINCIYVDRESNIWVGSSGKGLLKLTGETFTYFNKQGGLSSDLILSILETQEGDYYFSSYDNGITYLPKNQKPKAVKINSQSIWCSLQSKNGETYFGSSNGLYRLKNTTETEKIEGISGFTNKVSALKEISDNKILVGGKNGFAIISKDSITTINTEKTKGAEIKGFLEVNNAIIVLGQKELFKYENNQLTTILSPVQYNFSSISSIDGKIFIGAEQGLFQLENNELKQIELSNKTSANNVTFIKALHNELYVGTNDGLFIYNTVDDKLVHYGINEGLIDLETNINSGYFDSNNNFWFGTSNGLMRFDIEKRNEVFHKTIPLLSISGVSLSKSNLNIIEFADGYNNNGLPKNLKIPFKYNGISITLDGIYLSSPKTLKYASKLNDEEGVWSNLSQDKTINLASLSYGKYTLSAYSETRDGLRSETLNFSFEILPPYYAKTWFIIMCTVLLTLFSLLLIRANGNRIKKREKRKQFEEKLRFQTKLSKLEQQSLNASMNRHFIFNSLNSIQYYINANDKLSANKFLTRFAKLIRQNLDSSNTLNGLSTLKEELDRLELYMDLEKMRFSDKFNYKVTIEEGLDTENIDVPGMLLQPFVENSIIHGVLPRQDRNGLIQVKIKEKQDSYCIEILDNGVGIDNSTAQKKNFIGDHNSQGMQITSKRIAIMQKISDKKMELIGPLQINNQYGIINGTAVIINISKNSLEKH